MSNKAGCNLTKKIKAPRRKAVAEAILLAHLVLCYLVVHGFGPIFGLDRTRTQGWSGLCGFAGLCE
jgi:hypothetical protein